MEKFSMQAVKEFAAKKFPGRTISEGQDDYGRPCVFATGYDGFDSFTTCFYLDGTGWRSNSDGNSPFSYDKETLGAL